MSPAERLQEPITIRTHSKELDATYKQMHTVYTERESTMFCVKYIQSANNDIKYNNIELIGLSKDELTEADSIIYRGREYKVQYYIYTHVWNIYYLALYD